MIQLITRDPNIKRSCATITATPDQRADAWLGWEDNDLNGESTETESPGLGQGQGSQPGDRCHRLVAT